MMYFQKTGGAGHIGPEALDRMVRSGRDFMLLDVRTPFEHAMQAIEGSYLIPLQELGQRIEELPRDRDIVVYCRVGNRSAYACMHLARLGFRVKNLDGGIEGWNRAGAGRGAVAAAARG